MNEPLSFVHPSADSPWGTYLSQIDRVEPYLGRLSRWTETLRRCKRALIVDVPIERDDGSVAHFEGFRVQHNLSRGPGKGGVRYHPDVTLEEVMALSAWMTIVCCLPRTRSATHAVSPSKSFTFAHPDFRSRTSTG